MRRWLAGALVGTTAGAAVVLFEVLLRSFAGVSTPAELGADRTLPMLPVSNFLQLLGLAGGPIMAKELAYGRGLVPAPRPTRWRSNRPRSADRPNRNDRRRALARPGLELRGSAAGARHGCDSGGGAANGVPCGGTAQGPGNGHRGAFESGSPAAPRRRRRIGPACGDGRPRRKALHRGSLRLRRNAPPAPRRSSGADHPRRRLLLGDQEPG